MKSFKNLLDKIMFKMGYIPRQSPLHVSVQATKKEVVCLEVSKYIDNYRLVSMQSEEAELFMEHTLQTMRRELADYNPSAFEVLKYARAMPDPTVMNDEILIKMRLKIVKP